MHMGLKSRQLVCNLGQRLVAHELIHCISKDRNEFRDTAHSFYAFTPKGEEILSRAVPATPILPKNSVEMNLTNVAAKEIARQLTLIEFDTFKRIKIHEISWQAWNKKNGAECPNVTAMIQRFNKVGFWVATEIVSQRNHTSRVAVLKKLIKIAHICKKINNFNTMMEIAVGLNMGSVSRLGKVWAAIDAKTKNRFDEIMLLANSAQNYKSYREALKSATLPTLPYLALFLRDLTFIEDGNSNHMVVESEINFHKMRMLAKVFKSITHYQQAASYIFTPVLQLQKYLEGVLVMNETELYKMSYQCEPTRESTKLSSSVS
jgi:son of sevenless-like protein